MNTSDWVEGFEPRRTDPCICGSGRRFKQCCGVMSPDREPPQGILLRKQWLDAAQCEALVSFFEQQPRMLLTVRDPVTGQERPDPARVTEKVIMGDQTAEILDLVRAAFINVGEPELGFGIEWFTFPVILRYKPGGFYGVHSDSELQHPQTRLWKKTLDRDISLLIYLNDDFEGGHINFPQFNFRYQPGKGDLILFPSDNRYRHLAEPVTAGVRYAVVTWAAAADVPRVEAQRPPGAIFVHEGDA